jgi:ElaB/YqjD/DUF883 family membrane-anchored ribosome-binding protein
MSKKDLMDKLNPLYEQLRSQRDEAEALLDEMNDDSVHDSLTDLIDRMSHTLQMIRKTMDEAKD